MHSSSACFFCGITQIFDKPNDVKITIYNQAASYETIRVFDGTDDVLAVARAPMPNLPPGWEWTPSCKCLHCNFCKVKLDARDDGTYWSVSDGDSLYVFNLQRNPNYAVTAGFSLPAPGTRRMELDNDTEIVLVPKAHADAFEEANGLRGASNLKKSNL
ncbi:expressed unknown protein [Seminavis robusta]|uniref:Uncharacterized protein n=1 Tax=Seminavis robusta TaxID=568900 RepID=A0A9N8D437_9STRA|nr:expressed unknown protein [Seminavis robusta]|eukprot:Sro1_g000160.1 n/a (159) ;mRNA; f:61817-62293